MFESVKDDQRGILKAWVLGCRDLLGPRATSDTASQEVTEVNESLSPALSVDVLIGIAVRPGDNGLEIAPAPEPPAPPPPPIESDSDE